MISLTKNKLFYINVSSLKQKNSKKDPNLIELYGTCLTNYNPWSVVGMSGGVTLSETMPGVFYGSKNIRMNTRTQGFHQNIVVQL